MNRMLTSTYFTRLLLYSLIISILPLALLGYLSYRKSSSVVEDEVRKGNLLILQQNQSQVEQLLKTTDVLTTQTISGAVREHLNFSTVVTLPYAIENHRIFADLIKKMVLIQVFELGIHDVNLISFRGNWLVRNGVSYSYEKLNPNLREDAIILKLEKEMTAYQNTASSSYWKLEDHADHGYVLKLIKHIPVNSATPDGLITVNIPISEIVKKMSDDARLGTVVIASKEGVIIYHPDHEKIGTSLNIAIKDGPGEGSHTYRDKGEHHVVSYSRSAYNEWLYLSYVPVAQISQKSNAIKGYTLGVAAFILILVIAFVILGTKKMYSPIQRIYRSMLPEPDVLVKKDELHYIDQYVSGMMKTQSRMAGQMEGLKRQTKEYFITRWLRGEIPNYEVEEHLEQFNHVSSWDKWCVFSIEIDTLEGTKYEEKDRELLMYAVNNMVEEIIAESNRLVPVVMDRTQVTIVGKGLDLQKPFQMEMYEWAEMIVSKVRKFLRIKISVGISRLDHPLFKIPLAYRESLEALTYRVLLGHEIILFMDEVQAEKRSLLRYPKLLEQQLVDAMLYADVEQASTMLRAIIEKLSDHEIMHSDYYALLNRLYFTMIAILQDEGGSIVELLPAAAQNTDELMKLSSIESMIRWFQEHMLEPIITWLQDMRQTKSINISEEIMRMIHEEYDRDLSIELCADRINFHPSYVSRVFRKETGVTFSDYLNQHRLIIAKRWLLETDMKISEMAKKLCYSNSSNFIRNFRKFENMTPTQFRDKHYSDKSN